MPTAPLRTRPRRRLPALAALSAALLAATGCTVTLASEYDEHIDEAASSLQREMDAFLTTMQRQAGAAEGRYAPNAHFYQDYLVDLRAVEVRAAAHGENDITLQQIRLMRDNVEALRSAHEEQDRIGDAAAGTFRDLFNTAWRAVIQWELAKKRGEG